MQKPVVDVVEFWPSTNQSPLHPKTRVSKRIVVDGIIGEPKAKKAVRILQDWVFYYIDIDIVPNEFSMKGWPIDNSCKSDEQRNQP